MSKRIYTPDEIWNLLVRHRWLILIPVAIGVAAAPLLARLAPPRYRSEAMILVVPQQVPENYVQPTVVETVEDRLPGITAQILSRSRLEQIILEMNLYRAERERQVMEDVVQTMRTRDIRTTAAGRDINSFSVSYVSDDPETARRVAERLTSLYIEQNTRDRADQAESTSKLIDDQIATTKQRLLELEKKLEAYRTQYQGQLPSQVQTNLQSQQNAGMLLQNVNDSINRAEQDRQFLERQIENLKLFPLSAAPAPTGSEQRTLTTAEQLDAARAQLTAQLKVKTEDHPDITTLQRTIAQLEARLENETPLSAATAAQKLTPTEAQRQRELLDLENRLAGTKQQLTTLRADQARLRQTIASYEAKVSVVPTREAELIELTRDYDALSKAYADLLLKKEGASIAAQMERTKIGEQFRILDAASFPQRPYNDLQRWAVLASGAGTGLLLGMFVLGLREYRDSSFRSKDEVVKALSLPVLASIPVMKSDREARAAMRRARAMDVGGSAVLLMSVAVVVVWKFVS